MIIRTQNKVLSLVPAVRDSEQVYLSVKQIK